MGKKCADRRTNYKIRQKIKVGDIIFEMGDCSHKYHQSGTKTSCRMNIELPKDKILTPREKRDQVILTVQKKCSGFSHDGKTPKSNCNREARQISGY